MKVTIDDACQKVFFMTRYSRFLLLCLIAGTLLPLGQAQSDALRVVDFEVPNDFFADITLSLDEGDESVLFTVTADDPEDNLFLIEIEDLATGELLYSIDNDPEDNLFQFAFEPLSEFIGELSLFVPPTPYMPLVAGEYRFTFEAEISTITSVQAYIRSGNLGATHALDLVIWNLTDALLEDAAQTAFSDAAQTEMDALLGEHNLRVGEITIVNANDTDYNDYAFPQISEEDTSSLNELCAVMSERLDPTLALYVALIEGFDEIEADAGGTAGIAINAGNAGTILQIGSRGSCVVASYEAYGEDFANQAVNILHEGAHFMSLAHTTESGGDVFDFLNDTPECPATEFDGNDDGFVDDFECDTIGGASNVMFWSGEPEFAPYSFSTDQAWLLRRHPLFYPVGD